MTSFSDLQSISEYFKSSGFDIMTWLLHNRIGISKLNKLEISPNKNPFAMMVTGKIPVNKKLQEELELANLNYIVSENRPESAEKWNDKEYNTKNPGSASMAKTHLFLLLKKLHLNWFNIIVLILSEDYMEIKKGLDELYRIKLVATKFMKKLGIKNPGFFLHVFGWSSVHAFHLHMIDMDNTGPSFEHQKYKNMSLDTIIDFLKFKLGNIIKSIGEKACCSLGGGADNTFVIPIGEIFNVKQFFGAGNSIQMIEAYMTKAILNKENEISKNARRSGIRKGLEGDALENI